MITDTVKYVTSVALIVIGLGLCIGGIFFTPLLAIGGPILTAGLSLLGITFAGKETSVIFKSRRSPRAAPNVQQSTPLPVEPPILSFSHNYHVGINNQAPTRPNTPSDDSSMYTAQDSSPRATTLFNS